MPPRVAPRSQNPRKKPKLGIEDVTADWIPAYDKMDPAGTVTGHWPQIDTCLENMVRFWCGKPQDDRAGLHVYTSGSNQREVEKAYSVPRVEPDETGARPMRDILRHELDRMLAYAADMCEYVPDFRQYLIDKKFLDPGAKVTIDTLTLDQFEMGISKFANRSDADCLSLYAAVLGRPGCVPVASVVESDPRLTKTTFPRCERDHHVIKNLALVRNSISCLRGIMHHLRPWMLNQLYVTQHPHIPDNVYVSYMDRDFLDYVITTQQKKGTGEEDVGAPEDNLETAERISLYISRCARHDRLRRKNGVVYKEKYIRYGNPPREYGTRAWIPYRVGHTDATDEEASTIETYVDYVCNKQQRFGHWLDLNKPGTRKAIMEKLMNDQHDLEFMVLFPNRRYISCQNGILDIESSELENGVSRPSVRFHSYSDSYKELPPSTVSAKYIDREVDKKWLTGAWQNIETPAMESILEYQHTGEKDPENPYREGGPSSPESVKQLDMDFAQMAKQTVTLIDKLGNKLVGADRESAANTIHIEATRWVQKAQEHLDRIKKEGDASRKTPGKAATKKRHTSLPKAAQEWVYVFLGRLMHKLRKYDKWEIIPFVKGVAGTGKSSMGSIARKFFEAKDVGILSSNSETKFGLQNLYDKFMFICMELKHNISLDQAEFQSMVSGEDMSIARKNLTAVNKQWDAPGLLLGNDLPKWMDAAGSIARRMLIIHFRHKVSEKDADPDLDNKLEQELAALIIKCNRAYFEKVLESREKNIWDVLPPYFKEERDEFLKETQPLYALLLDESKFFIRRMSKNITEEQRNMEGWEVPYYVFQEKYHEMWKQMKPREPVALLTDDQLEGALPRYHCKKQRHTIMEGGRPIEDDFILGIRLREDLR